MHDAFGSFVLWLAVAAEVAIWTFVAYFVLRHCVPWDEIRADRALRRALRERVPALRERVRRLAAATRHPARRCRARWARELGDAMTVDAGRLLALSSASIDAVARHLGSRPRDAATIERNVTATVDCIEKMLRLRDEELPRIARERADLAREMLADLSKLRAGIAERVEEHAGAGVPLAYERRCIALLANAFAAYGAAAEDDPDAVFSRFSGWLVRIREIAESAELRAVVAKRLADIAEEMPIRAAHAKRLFFQARPFLAMLRADPRLARPGGRLAAVASAGSVIESAENRLAAAKVIAAEEGTDLGIKGESAKRLTEALLIGERALASLIMLEEDLLVAVTAFDAGGSGPRSN
ncbi:MAG TPA: hypothetical protein VL426_02220 [Candidatus Binatia bacterium]|nr:hypothetical protein [Candidatus Binatia bacterium]